MREPGFLARLAVLNVAPQREHGALLDELEAAGFDVLTLDGSGASDAAGLFAAASEQLFHGEPAPNWDSFADVLINVVVGVEHDKIALVWTHADKLLEGRLVDLLTAADVLAGTARTSAEIRPTFVTFFVGDGDAFT